MWPGEGWNSTYNACLIGEFQDPSIALSSGFSMLNAAFITSDSVETLISDYSKWFYRTQPKKKKNLQLSDNFPAWHTPDKWRPEYLINPLPLLYYSIATSVSHSDDFHLGVGIDGDDIIALRRLHTRFGVGLTIKIVLNEEVASMFEVDAAVIAHEAVGVVELVPRLHNCANNAITAACALG